MSYELRNRPRSPWSLCGSVVGHWSTKYEGSEVWFLKGTQNFIFVPCLWQDEKHLFLMSYSLLNLRDLRIIRVYLYLLWFNFHHFIFEIFYGVHIKIWVQDLNQKCLNYMYSFLLFCKCTQTYVEFGLRVLHYGYITEILRTVPAALHLQSQWKDDVLVFK